MIKIDGSFGEGGGQIVRSSLALSMLTQQGVSITNLRARRAKPGLMRQHLTAVQAAASICNAAVEGDSIGSSSLTFKPGKVVPGSYFFDIGSSGSTTLVLQTVLPALWMAEGPSKVTLRGGTHNIFAPPFDFLNQAYLPLINQMGPKIELRLERHGFYPGGGGKIVAEIKPAHRLEGFELLERGDLIRRHVRALVSNLPLHIAERECATIRRLSDWDPSNFETREVTADGPGNAVLIEVSHQHVNEVFVGFGQRGVPAERVAELAWQEACTYLHSNVPVGLHLADQLILPCGLAAQDGSHSKYRIGILTDHTLTHAEVLAKFLDVQVEFTEEESGMILVGV